MLRLLLLTILVVLLLGTAAKAEDADPEKLNTEVIRLYEAGKYREAIPIAKKVLKIHEEEHGLNHPNVGKTLNILALLVQSQGRYAAAALLFQRSLSIYEIAHGQYHPQVARSLSNLAGLYKDQARFAEAEPLIRRSLKIHAATKGLEHPDYAGGLSNLALILDEIGRHQEAETLYRQSQKIYERTFGRHHVSVAVCLNNLANLFLQQGRYSEAEALLKRSLSIYKISLGPDHINVAGSLNNLAQLHQAQGRYKEAESLYRRSLEIRVRSLGTDHPNVGHSLNNLASLAFEEKNWTEAAIYWRRATKLLAQRVRRNGTIGNALTGRRNSETIRYSWYFHGLVKSVYREHSIKNDFSIRGAAMFPKAQWALASEAAGALAQMSARVSSDDPGLRELIRERQDLVGEWQRRDQSRSKFLSLPVARREGGREAANNARLKAIDQRIDVIDSRLEQDYPNYATLINPAPLTVKETQELLNHDEALILFLDTGSMNVTSQETFIWVVTRTDFTWARTSLGTGTLTTMVKLLRCGLDVAGWQRDNSMNNPCSDLTGRSLNLGDYAQGNAKPPFEPKLAFMLYDHLFGEIEQKLFGKKLLLVPSGPLTSLPFQVLLSKKPAEGDKFQDMPWLIRDHALTVLPSVASLKALRRNAKASAAENPFLGFGNPLLLGRSGNDKSAWAKQTCQFQAQPKPLRVAGLTIPDAISKYFRGGAVNVALLKRQAPLPETADELCAVAETIGASPSAVHLGAKATEAEVKRLSKDGTLQQAKILHFATHGLLADETGQLLENKAEPSLLLTPPDKATDEDDGLLTASEITQLKLDADWVILSACNTAAGDKPGAEPMSGLAKAFFYAGARALLISHWAVQSDATVALITKSFAAQKQDPSLGRAGALRAAMLSLINSNHMAHPEYWAPFIVVGEGN